MPNLDKQRHYFVNKGPSSQGCGFSSSHVWMWELDYKESRELKNWRFWTVVLEDSPLDCKEIQPVHPKGDQSWVFIVRTDVEAETPNTFATWCEELTHLKRSWCWERLRAGEGDDRGWDGWMASPTQWTWVWVDSGSWWWTGRPGKLRFMGSQSRTRLSDWTELGYNLTFALDKWLFLSILVQVLLKCFFFGPLLIHKLSTLTGFFCFFVVVTPF